MLTKLTLESAVVLAEELERRKLGIVPDQNTPVEELFEASTPVDDKIPQTEEAIVSSLESMAMSPIETTPETHDNVLDTITETVSGLMNRRLNLAKNFINPLIGRYTDAISKHMETYVPEQMEVNEIDFGDFYTHPLVRNVFQGYAIKGVDPVSGFKGIAFNEDNNYHLDALKTGSEFIDKKLNAILEERGQEWYRDLANRYFTQGEDFVITKPEVSEGYREVADANLVAHMLARHFYNRDEPIVNMDKAEQDGKLLDILGRTSQNINNLCNMHDDYCKREVVVENRIAKESINVFAPMYRKFIEKGGNNMMLAGYVKTKGPRLGIESIMLSKEEFENIHDKDISQKVRQVRSETVRLVRLGALNALPEIVKLIPQEVINTIDGLQGPGIDAQSELYRRGQEYINNNNVDTLNDIYSYASNVITLGLLPELELYRFYSTMEKFLKPAMGGLKLTPKQAAYYACLEEVIQYFLSQVSLSSVK